MTNIDKAQNKILSESDSIVEACLPFADLLSGKRVHVSFDCPENLRKAFNSVNKANGTSSCHVLRSFMQTFIVAAHYKKACFSNTIEPVKIENLVMPTYVKSRVRRYAVKEETVSFDRCHFCRKSAVGMFEFVKTGVVYPLCSFHAKEFVDGKVWSVIKRE